MGQEKWLLPVPSMSQKCDCWRAGEDTTFRLLTQFQFFRTSVMMLQTRFLAFL